MTRFWLEKQDRYLLAHQQSVILMDLLIARDIKPDFFLRKTGLFYEDVASGSKHFSPEQFAQLCDNASQLPNSYDLAFLFGQRMLPGHFGSLSSGLQNAPSLRHALAFMDEFAILLFPLLAPKLRTYKEQLNIDFIDVFGVSTTTLLSKKHTKLALFLKNMTVTAITSLTSWLSQQSLPWSFYFDYPAPDNQSEYDVFLGQSRYFSQTFTTISIPESYLDLPWKRASPTLFQLALEESRLSVSKLEAQQSLLSLVSNQLNTQIRSLPSLEQMSDALNLSPATLKRKLKAHNTSYQTLCDQTRKRVSINLINELGYNEAQVAEYLNFYDVSNFRRSFKRWQLS